VGAEAAPHAAQKKTQNPKTQKKTKGTSACSAELNSSELLAAQEGSGPFGKEPATTGN